MDPTHKQFWYKKLRNIPKDVRDNIWSYMENETIMEDLIKQQLQQTADYDKELRLKQRQINGLQEDLNNLTNSYRMLEDYTDRRDMDYERLIAKNARLNTRLDRMTRQYDEMYNYLLNHMRNVRRRLDFDINDNDENENENEV